MSQPKPIHHVYMRGQLEALYQLSLAFKRTHGCEQWWWAMYKENVSVIMADVAHSSLISDKHFTAYGNDQNVCGNNNMQCTSHSTPVAQSELSIRHSTHSHAPTTASDQTEAHNQLLCPETVLKVMLIFLPEAFSDSAFRTWLATIGIQLSTMCRPKAAFCMLLPFKEQTPTYLCNTSYLH